MTPQEFSARLALQKAIKPKLNNTRTFKMPEGVEAPAHVDWRGSAVTPIKNQGDCGSCWAFSLTGSTEGAYALKTGNIVLLSEQQLVDCTMDINYGCGGGYLEDNFPYISEKGLQSENSYPYEGVDGKCRYDESNVVTRVDDYVVIANDETALQNAVGTVGPVSVSINADFIQFYESGIFHLSLCYIFGLNHGVLAVGYGSENGTDYWVVKNSWGADWGENGYIRFKRGVNECGIAYDNVYPIIN
ncbi:procathepsin L-like [Rhynchophorus ferrugineus]|uniref:procathepsin L-like n=1 Tax=Rhynchophorus ferrugineus TaxID=354439 RepID=UPI003FCDF890